MPGILTLPLILVALLQSDAAPLADTSSPVMAVGTLTEIAGNGDKTESASKDKQAADDTAADGAAADDTAADDTSADASIAVDGKQLEVDDSKNAKKPAIKWFDIGRIWQLFFVVAVSGGVIGMTALAARGVPVYVRPIAGLDAIEEAVGRSTEMGRPIMFIPGILDINEIETVAGINILHDIARVSARYDTTIVVPTARTMVMSVAQESVQTACLEAGRPENYNEEEIYYVTDDQFAYVSHVCGRMNRERPAACFYLGKFFAESLLLAESGNAVGAIQVGGTAEVSQLPFFVAACDYTLLGEELFAASAYLSRDPAQLGCIKGQDLGKILAVGIILMGCLLGTIQQFAPTTGGAGNADGTFFSRVDAGYKYLKGTILNPKSEKKD